MTTVATVSSSDVILGVTHLLVDGQLTPLLKCPFCKSLRNIHVEAIEHHIRHTHAEKRYSVEDFYHKGRVSSPYGPYISKKDMPGQWIRCLWCNYRDKIEFDLSLHMLEKHGGGKFADHKLLQIPVFSSDRKRAKILSGDLFARFEGAIEFRLDVAVEMAKEENRGKGVRHAIRILEKRAIGRRRAKEQQQQGQGGISN